MEQTLSEIRQKINSLTEIEGIDLKNEMAALKQALIQNPEACALLLPEEIGACVAALRKIMNATMADAVKSKKTSVSKPKTMSKEDLKKAISELSDEDFLL